MSNIMFYKYIMWYYDVYYTSRTYARRGIRCVLSFIFICIIRIIIVRIFIILFTLSLNFLHFGSLILKPYLHYSNTQSRVFSQGFSYLNKNYIK